MSISVFSQKTTQITHFLVQFLGITSAPNPMCIVAEFLSEGSLKSFLQSNQEMDTAALKSIVKGVCAGMLHLHKVRLNHSEIVYFDRKGLFTEILLPEMC